MFNFSVDIFSVDGGSRRKLRKKKAELEEDKLKCIYYCILDEVSADSTFDLRIKRAETQGFSPRTQNKKNSFNSRSINFRERLT